jgi:ATP-dependent helicase HrpB
MVGGRGVRLAEQSAVHVAECFVCVDVHEIGRSEAVVRQASRVDKAWLPAELITREVAVRFDEAGERVVAVQQIRFEDLVIEETQTDAASLEMIEQVLSGAAAKRLDQALPLKDESVVRFLARVRSLRQWMPELNLPEFDESDLRELLPQLCAGRRSFKELRSVRLVDYLRSRLTPNQERSLERDAPERLLAASGNRIRLEYEPGQPPVMAVRIQEMFGQVETPRVAGGRIPVRLHLLGPNLRPQQVTDDLRSFWQNTYPVMRKELRRRYPKHAWPEDPLQAAPTSRPRGRQ